MDGSKKASGRPESADLLALGRGRLGWRDILSFEVSSDGRLLLISVLVLVLVLATGAEKTLISLSFTGVVVAWALSGVSDGVAAGSPTWSGTF